MSENCSSVEAPRLVYICNSNGTDFLVDLFSRKISNILKIFCRELKKIDKKIGVIQSVSSVTAGQSACFTLERN